MDKKFSKGEWVHDAPGCVGISYPEGGKRTICTSLRINEEGEANMDLIAAAPELYDALKMLVEYMELRDNDGKGIVNIAQAALRKARGEATK